MNNAELVAHLKRLIAKLRPDQSYTGVHSEIVEFLRTYIGPSNAYLGIIGQFSHYSSELDTVIPRIRANLQALIESIEAGAHAQLSPERKAQLDVVSDFLQMAQDLLERKEVHPASPAVIVGATLEEFLRNWVESAQLALGSRKPGIETYVQVLRDANLINKQDGKDITSWAGIRNHAAHGEWEEVGDKARVRNMLEGVNLFMRRYTPS